MNLVGRVRCAHRKHGPAFRQSRVLRSIRWQLLIDAGVRHAADALRTGTCPGRCTHVYAWAANCGDSASLRTCSRSRDNVLAEAVGGSQNQ